ncbi:hypothetical protein [Embleya hyalina]|uniref:Uncharacterized protein n=1 Tax=Embleya hyalina TaxID=516124 RepID=A0A401YIM1_9ACTN|nr:hypothetical protein [Embleya hyalina]GCD94440.1 hypothetical protein EHYA_02108 [Embleya hyalina]
MDDHIDEHEHQDGPEPDGRTWRTWATGELIELPATIAGIRAALPAEQREEFTKAIEDTPARDLPLTLNRWVRRTRPEVDEAIERTHDWVEGIHAEADAMTIMGEERSVVLDRVQSRLREGPPESAR